MIRFLLLAMLLAVPAAAELPDWLYIGSDKDNSRWYLRTEDWHAGHSQARSAKAWILIDARRDKTAPWRQARVLHTVDCVAELHRIDYVSLRYANGKTESFPGDGKIEVIVPGSVFGLVAEELCADPTGPISRT